VDYKNIDRMNPMKEQHIDETDDGIRLDRWFKRHFPSVPHGLIEKNLRKGLIRLDGKKAKSSDRIAAGQSVKFPEMKVDAKKEGVASARDANEIQKWVIYKDKDIIIVNKPAGLAVQGGSKITRSLDGMLDGLRFGSTDRPRLVHRLDRDTSGCLVLARNAKVAAALGKAFAGRDMEKTYWALVIGQPEPLSGKIDLPLIKKENPLAQGKPGGPEGRDYEVMMVDEEEGQVARTEYRVIDMLGRKFSLMELKPLTGRTHQLRVHMQAIGCPILGDHKYGGGTESAEALGVENILHLHAQRIVIPPLFGNNKVIDVVAPLPAHMKKSFEALGIEVRNY
jgi:23S rRNA pseudouridine955/2504/2580 synthase